MPGQAGKTPARRDIMAARVGKRKRDIEKNYPVTQFVKKLRRLADCLEQGKTFRIQLAGERIVVPPGAVINIEHERGASAEELEFQMKWRLER
jgi:amphi-Trp domain-containing protein